MLLCYSSNKSSENFLSKHVIASCADAQLAPLTHEENSCVITLNPTKTYQSLLGFGGAFTEAGAYALSFLDTDTRAQVIDSFFGESGLQYSLCRTHIQSCDFSLSNYAYVDDKNDTSLSSFSIQRDTLYLIPFISAALKHSVHDVKLIASPWSPPAFMKTNDSMNHGGSIRPQYRQLWAECIAKYILAYNELEIPIWGLSVQNEAEATQTWDSCIFTAKEEGEFITDFLHPTLQSHSLNPKIIIWDHNRDRLFERVQETFAHPGAKELIWGAGFHWYEENVTGVALHSEVEKTHNAYPDTHLLLTEACQELELFGHSVPFGIWDTAERYVRNIIGDLNAWAEGWIDWNMILNIHGGPNHANNFCDASLRIDTDNATLHYSNIYHAMGHFSKFIKPGAVRIEHTIQGQSNIHCSTWKKDNTITMVAMNDTDTTITLGITHHTHNYILNIEPHSIHSFELEA